MTGTRAVEEQVKLAEITWVVALMYWGKDKLSGLLARLKVDAQRRNMWAYACFDTGLGDHDVLTKDGQINTKLDVWSAWEGIASREQWLVI